MSFARYVFQRTEVTDFVSSYCVFLFFFFPSLVNMFCVLYKKSLPNWRSQAFSHMFPVRNSLLDLGLWSVGVNFYSWCEVSVDIHCLLLDTHLFQHHLLEKTHFFLPRLPWPIYVWVFFWGILFHWSLSLSLDQYYPALVKIAW